MLKQNVKNVVLNFSAVLLLICLIAAPIYFAKNITQIAGVRTESNYLLISQVEKFPQMTFTQTQNSYSVSFTKQAEEQAYLSVFIINNPTEKTKVYKINNNSSSNTVFFGDNINSQETEITLPAQTSAPVSLFSESTSLKESAAFSILDKQ